MIPRNSRLPRDGFRGRGYRTFQTPYFSLKVKANALLVPRIGVIVGKSVDKRAVRRNFWERQAKAQFMLASLGQSSRNKDFVLTIFPKVQTLGRVDFIKELQKAIRAASNS